MNLRLALLATLFLISASLRSSAQAPTGNDNQGGVAAPPGKYFGMPSAGPVPVNAYTANSTRVIADLHATYVGEIPLSWIRFSNTRATTGSIPFGPGGYWRHGFQWDFSTTTVNGVAALEVIYPDGTTNFFTQTSPGQWTSTSAVTDIITPSGTGYNLTTTANHVFNFVPVASGFQLSKITDAKGQVTTLTYGTYGVTKVTEPGGRYLTIAYSPYESELISSTPPHTGPNSIGGGGLSPQTSGGSTTIYSYFISSVTSSDGRYTHYSYGATTTSYTTASQYITVYHNYLKAATYSDSTVASYTYAPLGPAGQAGANNYVTEAQDTRASGVPSVNYSYYTGTTDPVGAVLTSTEVTSGETVSTVATQGGNSQTPQVTYPDSSLYDYTVNPGGLMASVTNTLGNINTYAYTSNTGSWTTTATDANNNAVMVQLPVFDV